MGLFCVLPRAIVNMFSFLIAFVLNNQSFDSIDQNIFGWQLAQYMLLGFKKKKKSNRNVGIT